MTSVLTTDDVDSILAEIEQEEATTSQPSVSASASPKSEDRVQTFIDQTELKSDIAFNEDDIQVAFMNQASLFVHYAQKAHKARFQSDSLKNKIDVLESRLDGQIRKAAASDGVKLTESAIASMIKSDPEHIKATQMYLEARTIADLCKDVLEAFRHRRDMLVQFGADVRQEREGELRMRSREETETTSQRAKRISGK